MGDLSLWNPIQFYVFFPLEIGLMKLIRCRDHAIILANRSPDRSNRSFFCIKFRCVVTEENVIWQSIARNLRRTSIGILYYELFFFVQFKFPNYKMKVYPNNEKKKFYETFVRLWFYVIWYPFGDISSYFSTDDIKKVAS